MANNTRLNLSIIILFKDKAEMTIACIESLIRYGPDVKEIILVSNNSSTDQMTLVKEGVHRYQNIFMYERNIPFNFQELNNWAAEKASSGTLLFLNNDTELVGASAGLVERMYKESQKESVGAVGCILLYGDGRRVQHAGVYLKNGGMAENLYSRESYKVLNSKKDSRVYKDMPRTAVTAACLMVEKKKFTEVGGFNEEFIIGGGDVDLCIRLNKAGYQAWCLGASNQSNYILHKESLSRVGIKMPWSDYIQSYRSYIAGLDSELLDPFLLHTERERI